MNFEVPTAKLLESLYHDWQVLFKYSIICLDCMVCFFQNRLRFCISESGDNALVRKFDHKSEIWCCGTLCSLPEGASSWWALARDWEVEAAVVAMALVRDWYILSHFCCKYSLSFSIAGCRSTFLLSCLIKSMTSRFTALGIDFRLLLIRNWRLRLSWSLRKYVCSFALEAASTNKAGNSAFFSISADWNSIGR